MARQKKELNIEVGARLKAIRINNNSTQSEYAELLGISDENYRKIENGAVELTLDKIFILYKVKKIDPNYLILGISDGKEEIEYYIKNSNKKQLKEILQTVIDYMLND